MLDGSKPDLSALFTTEFIALSTYPVWSKSKRPVIGAETSFLPKTLLRTFAAASAILPS